jgi:phosphatidylglycerophosphate synthase
MRETAVEPNVDRFTLFAPALLLLAFFTIAFATYCTLCAIGRAPQVGEVKHNQLFGPFWARFVAWLVGPAERALAGRVSPNAITALSLAMCAATGIAVGLGELQRAVWLYAAAGVLDILDGRLARLSNRQTAAGALFDSVSDRWGELFVFAGYAWLLHDSPWLLAVVAAFGASMMVSYTRARAEGLGVAVATGAMQRAERIVLVTGGTFVAAWCELSSPDIVVPIIGATLAACGALSAGTALHRWILAYRALARAAAPVVVAEAVEHSDERPAIVLVAEPRARVATAPRRVA